MRQVAPPARAELLSVTMTTAETYTRDARRDEKAEQKAAAWGAWLDCLSTPKVAEMIGVSDESVRQWVSKFSEFCTGVQNSEPPDSRQHFDVWSFGADGTTSGHFGKMASPR